MIDLPEASDSGAARMGGWNVLLSLIGLYFVVSLPLQLWDLPFGLGFSELFCLAIPVVLLVRAQGQDPVSFLGLGPPRPQALASAALVAVVGYGFSGALNSLNNAFFDARTLEEFNPARLFNGPPLQQGILLFSVIVLAPLGEEMLFRGYALRVFAARRGARYGVLITAAVFAAMHVNPTSVLALFALGVIFALLRLQSGSLWSSLLAHALQNGISSALVLTGVLGDSPDTLSVPAALLLLLVTTPALLLALRLHAAAARPRIEPATGEHAFDLTPLVPWALAWLGGGLGLLAAYAVLLHR